MSNEKKVFTLEDIKLASMGPDTIVYIPRALKIVNLDELKLKSPTDISYICVSDLNKSL